MPRTINTAGLRRGGLDRREGRRHRQVRRALIVASTEIVSGRELMAAVYPRQPWTEWRWRDMRKSAERYAERILPRTRPLMWRAKQDFKNER
jgi:hypothetical protein